LRLNVPIQGVEAEIIGDTLAIQLEVPLKTLSSAVLNGGFVEARAIINQHIPKDYDHADPEGLLSKMARKLGLPKPVVGFMTAANIRNVAVTTERYKDLIVNALITAGLSYPATAGDAVAFPLRNSGTINIILLVDGNLTDSGMVDAVKTVTEAKSVTLRELDVRSFFSGEVASGTITDSVIVTCTGRGELIKYAGTATKLGELIGKSVRKAVKEAIQKQEGKVFL
jgi:adenosylcobinamide amidohydrolase